MIARRRRRPLPDVRDVAPSPAVQTFFDIIDFVLFLNSAEERSRLSGYKHRKLADELNQMTSLASCPTEHVKPPVPGFGRRRRSRSRYGTLFRDDVDFVKRTNAKDDFTQNLGPS
ncbi:hypothetical protein EVAR_61645_1 [Eumeta japonica]|uniref:Uncharacterized protein n=1 Tax=Eumeta variegata TaxID=151549 RepID=A0A4C1Z7Q2_EUMVA|nr:hypothetical protein EVAR_61645_1 [Eumeta japonica]